MATFVYSTFPIVEPLRRQRLLVRVKGASAFYCGGGGSGVVAIGHRFQKLRSSETGGGARGGDGGVKGWLQRLRQRVLNPSGATEDRSRRYTIDLNEPTKPGESPLLVPASNRQHHSIRAAGGGSDGDYLELRVKAEGPTKVLEVLRVGEESMLTGQVHQQHSGTWSLQRRQRNGRTVWQGSHRTAAVKEALAVEIQQLEAASLREQQHIDRLQQWMKSYKKLMEDTDNRKKQEGLRVQRALEEKAAAERAAALAAVAAVAAADRKKRKSDAAAEAAGGKVAGDDDDNSEEERDGSSGRVWRRLLGGGSGRRRDTKRGSFLFRSPVKASRSRASSMRAKSMDDTPPPIMNPALASSSSSMKLSSSSSPSSPPTSFCKKPTFSSANISLSSKKNQQNYREIRASSEAVTISKKKQQQRELRASSDETTPVSPLASIAKVTTLARSPMPSSPKPLRRWSSTDVERRRTASMGELDVFPKGKEERGRELVEAPMESDKKLEMLQNSRGKLLWRQRKPRLGAQAGNNNMAHQSFAFHSRDNSASRMVRGASPSSSAAEVQNSSIQDDILYFAAENGELSQFILASGGLSAISSSSSSISSISSSRRLGKANGSSSTMEAQSRLRPSTLSPASLGTGSERFIRRVHQLSVHVLEARDLRPADLSGFSDPFVKCCVMGGHSSFSSTFLQGSRNRLGGIFRMRSRRQRRSETLRRSQMNALRGGNAAGIPSSASSSIFSSTDDAWFGDGLHRKERVTYYVKQNLNPKWDDQEFLFDMPANSKVHPRMYTLRYMLLFAF